MDSWILLIRLILCGIFLLAGVAKFLDLKGSKKAFEDFGIPSSISLPSSIALSVAEIVIGLMFLRLDTSWYAAVAAAGLMLLFVVQMTYQTAKGNSPDCHCFGQVHSAPVGVKSILRNVAFAVLALALIARGQTVQGRSLVDPTLDIFQLAFGLFLIGLLIAVIFYLKKLSTQQIELMRRIEVMNLVAREGGETERETTHPHDGLPIGAMFPEFEHIDTDGKMVTLADIRSTQRPVLFLFVSPTCNPCKALVPEFEEWERELTGKIDLVFISNGKAEDNLEKLGGTTPKRILLQKQRELADKVNAAWTPTALLTDRNGRLASHPSAGDAAIRALIEKIMKVDPTAERFFIPGENGRGPKSRMGETPKPFAVSDLDGQQITPKYFTGRQTLVAFWSEHCSHCVNMIDDLRQWDKSRSNGDPALLVFTDGDDDFLKGLDLTSPVVHDVGHKTSSTLGMQGTPSAVLVDEDGVIISETAMGAAEIWSLVGRKR